MYKPMPSPNGTNYEQLYIRDRNPVAAYDSAPLPHLNTRAQAQAYGREYARKLLAQRGMAGDLELPEAEQNVRQNELDEVDAEIEASINSLVEWCKGNLSYKDIGKVVSALLDHTGAMDGSPRFGVPRVAQDARRVHSLSGADRERFNQMFPGAANLKIL